jgi:hypothetical protein
VSVELEEPPPRRDLMAPLPLVMRLVKRLGFGSPVLMTVVLPGSPGMSGVPPGLVRI